MRLIRGTANTVLTVTLVRPIVRRLLARARRRAQEHPVSPLMIPAQELLETALLAELTASEIDGQPALDDAIEEVSDRNVMRTVLLVGALAAAVALAAAAGRAAILRRRQARTPEPETAQSEWVAVPVERPAEAAVTAEAPTAELSTP